MLYIYSYLVVEVMEDGNINNLFKSWKGYKCYYIFFVDIELI